MSIFALKYYTIFLQRFALIFPEIFDLFLKVSIFILKFTDLYPKNCDVIYGRSFKIKATIAEDSGVWSYSTTASGDDDSKNILVQGRYFFEMSKIDRHALLVQLLQELD